jgi:hypothetical protein
MPLVIAFLYMDRCGSTKPNRVNNQLYPCDTRYSAANHDITFLSITNVKFYYRLGVNIVAGV